MLVLGCAYIYVENETVLSYTTFYSHTQDLGSGVCSSHQFLPHSIVMSAQLDHCDHDNNVVSERPAEKNRAVSTVEKQCQDPPNREGSIA